MLLEISTTHTPATDLGYLLHKHPAKAQAFDLAFGRAHVYYPEATDARCTAALLVEVDPVALVRGRGVTLDQYVNDRPYVASSFLSTAISKVYGTAMGGRCKDRPALVEAKIPLEARIPALPARGGPDVVRRMFEPLGYEVKAEPIPLDPAFPEWGESPYVSLTLRGTVRLADLLTHLYVLVPALDARKHYYVGDDEVEKLMAKGERWLAAHPERETITKRYLRFRSLTRPALDRLAADDPVVDDAEAQVAEDAVETPVRLNTQRMEAVHVALKASGARRVVDLGCSEGRLMRDLVRDGQFTGIVGVDVSVRALERARDRLHLGEDAAPKLRERVRLLHRSLVYQDAAAEVNALSERLDLGLDGLGCRRSAPHEGGGKEGASRGMRGTVGDIERETSLERAEAGDLDAGRPLVAVDRHGRRRRRGPSPALRMTARGEQQRRAFASRGLAVFASPGSTAASPRAKRAPPSAVEGSVTRPRLGPGAESVRHGLRATGPSTGSG